MAPLLSPDPAESSGRSPASRPAEVIVVPPAAVPVPPLTASQRVVASMVHLFAIIPVWGLFAAFWVWHTRREEHPELRFQALQAMMWQGVGLLITVVYALAQLFFRLVAVLDTDLSETLCRINTLLWEAVLLCLALAALWAVFAVRRWGRHEYPVLGPALRREVMRADEEGREP
jgi:uncharacterized Tic20 family protein